MRGELTLSSVSEMERFSMYSCRDTLSSPLTLTDLQCVSVVTMVNSVIKIL